MTLSQMALGQVTISIKIRKVLVRLLDAFGLFEPLKKIQPVGRRITDAVYHALDYISLITCGSDRINPETQCSCSLLPHCELHVWMNLVRNRQHTRDLVSLEGSQIFIHIAFEETRARKPTRSGRLATPTSPCAL